MLSETKNGKTQNSFPKLQMLTPYWPLGSMMWHSWKPYSFPWVDYLHSFINPVRWPLHVLKVTLLLLRISCWLIVCGMARPATGVWHLFFLPPPAPRKKTPAYVSGMLYPSRKNQMIDLVRLLTWVMGSWLGVNWSSECRSSWWVQENLFCNLHYKDNLVPRASSLAWGWASEKALETRLLQGHPTRATTRPELD